MDKHSESLWQRSLPVWKTIWNARKRFHEARDAGDPLSAHINLASDYYTVAGGHTAGWSKGIGVACARRAVRNVRTALVLADGDYAKFTISQIDVMSRILIKVPKWLGGDRDVADMIISFALAGHPEATKMRPHDMAHLHNSLGLIGWDAGDISYARYHFEQAASLAPAIETEDSPDREKQLVRILSEAGCFLWKYPADDQMRDEGAYMVLSAYSLAKRVALDQVEKIRTRAEKVGFRLN